MATRQQRRPASAQTGRQRPDTMRQIISSDIMGNRNVEVVPVGAWVEPTRVDHVQPDVVRAAQVEEEKIRRLKNEKENKLRNFQQQTRHRVNEANQLKRQQQIQEAEQAFDLERKVVQQSSLTGNSHRKDTCVVRSDLDLAIRKRLLEKYGEDVKTWDKNTAPVLQSHAEESHQVTENARKQLMSKKVAQDVLEDNLLGNGWRTRTTRDFQMPAMKGIVDVAGHPTMYNASHGRPDTDEDDVCSPAKGAGSTGKDHRPTSKSQNGDIVENGCDGEDGKENTCLGVDKRFHFVDESKADQQRKKKKRQRSLKRPKSAQLASILFQDSESDVLARQRRQQTAVSRKIFMDREREAVRENLRRQQHRRKIQILKKEKEIYRHELEDMAYRKLEPTDPVTGETKEEIRLRERMEAIQIKEEIDEQRNEMRREREMKRYLNALRHTLMEKASRQGIQLPSLCACGTTVWETHPDTCANNCFFYKNHRAFARALQSLLSSTEELR